MEEGLVRVESAVTATASGNLTWEKWPYDVATALGLSGRRNPLGFAMVRYLDSPSRFTAQEVVLQLATCVVKRGFDGVVANEAAWKALEFWNDTRCPKCEGRGIVGNGVHSCQTCKGTGHRSCDDKSGPVRDAISCLIEAEQWLEGQIGARMRR
jgi:hypothetical protein